MAFPFAPPDWDRAAADMNGLIIKLISIESTSMVVDDILSKGE